MAGKPGKTNAMRSLDAAGIAYEVLPYRCDGKEFDGEKVAAQLGLSPCRVFKTLVTRDERDRILICCIPVSGKLDRKALALAAAAKRVDMTHPDELVALTGYLRGGCSPVGMKKAYPTFVDETALHFDRIAVSAGLRGLQLYLSPAFLLAHTGATTGRFMQSGG